MMDPAEFEKKADWPMLLSLTREGNELRLSGLFDARVLLDLISQIILQRTHARVSEEVTILPNVLEREVRLRSDPNSHRRLLVISKPRKEGNFRDFRMESQGLDVLNFHRSQAILLGCLNLLGRMAKGGALSLDEQLHAMRCITAVTDPDQNAARAAASRWVSGMKGNSDAKLLLASFMSVVLERRPILVQRSGLSGDLDDCRFRHAEPILKPDEGTSVPLSLWMSWARYARSWWGSAPKLMSIPLPGALASQRFSVAVNAPIGTYIRDVGLWDYQRRLWYPNLSRESYYEVFTGHQVLPGMRRAQATISSTSESAMTVLKNPRLAVRISEVPPGSIGAGALLSISVWLLIWLFGAFFPSGDSPFFDLAALALAVPSSVFAVFSLNTRESPYSSLSAQLSSLVSMTLSFLAILLLVAAQNTPALLALTNLARPVMLTTNGLWLALEAVGLLNAIWCSLDLMRARLRYRALRTEDLNFYGKKD
ncbi:MAG: hypothetical protein IT193_16950 [Propionibacteriaceae bacterium]|nr:hypothetical protein [Propionibacteriaceae bacterium]